MSSASAAKKRMLYIGGAVAVLAALQWQFNIIPIRASREAVVPDAVELATEADSFSLNTNVTAVPIPASKPTTKGGAPIRINIIPWNAFSGAAFANGGAKTTEGSLVEKAGIRVNIERQDDTSKTAAALVQFAEELSQGTSQPSSGVHFALLMGDGVAAFNQSIAEPLAKLGPEYHAEVIGAVGYSGNDKAGEDKFMGPPEWRDNPEAARGGLVSGYLRDGDWNLAMYWLTQNGIKNNPDETTWDPDALNWLATDDFMKAADAYNSQTCVDRKVVKNGKLTGETKRNICVNGVVTWTPGDVEIVKKRGGLVNLMSTKENRYQMPSVLVGIAKWNNANAAKVTAMLDAFLQGGDQVRSFAPARQKAAEVMYNITAFESKAWWARYYEGSVEKDKQGNVVPLGGSRAINLADNLVLFGMHEGDADLGGSIWNATYTGFGNIVRQQYPSLVPSFPTVGDSTNLTFLAALYQKYGDKSIAEATTEYSADSKVSDVIAKRNYNIEFAVGSATLTPSGLSTLTDIYNAIIVSNLAVDITGHTDNTGSAATNTALSAARAEAVASFLRSKSPALFTSGRVTAEGRGPSEPIADNATAEGRARNRRVTIILGNK